jgi:hypothetical protein
LEERRCCWESRAASKDTRRTANCALFRTALFLRAQKLDPVVLTACSNSFEDGVRCFTPRDEGVAEPNSIWRRPSIADRDGLDGACRYHSD